jgi:hypothetical protein
VWKKDTTMMMETGEIDFDTDAKEDNNNNKVNEEKSKEFFTLEDFTTFMTINHFECFVSNIIRR